MSAEELLHEALKLPEEERAAWPTACSRASAGRKTRAGRRRGSRRRPTGPTGCGQARRPPMTRTALARVRHQLTPEGPA